MTEERINTNELELPIIYLQTSLKLVAYDLQLYYRQMTEDRSNTDKELAIK